MNSNMMSSVVSNSPRHAGIDIDDHGTIVPLGVVAGTHVVSVSKRASSFVKGYK
mgnify:CR=1 FL=1